MSRIKRFEDLFAKLFELSGDGDKPRYINKKSLLRKLVDTDGVEKKYFEAIEIVLKEEEKDVEPVRHGHWIKREKMDNGLIDEFIECSNCGEEFDYILALSTLGYCEKNREDVFLFCPHCGAKMYEEKEQ